MIEELFENNSKLFNELIYPELRKGYLGHHATEEAKSPASAPPTSPATLAPAESEPPAAETAPEETS